MLETSFNRFRIAVMLLIASFLFTFAAFSQPEYEDYLVEEEIEVTGEEDWLWGEVLSVYNQNNKMKLKVLDEETMEEKEIFVIVDNETIFDNVDSLLDIKPMDNISLDYIITPDGKNVARRITVEKALDTGLSLPESVLNSTQITYP